MTDAAVAGGFKPLPGAVNARRPLGYSATEPVLSFAHPASSSFNKDSTATRPQSRFPPFQTAQEIQNLVYTDGKRRDELRPYGETTSDYGGGGSRTNSLAGDLFGPPSTTAATSGGGDDDGDGFDLDDVYGKSDLGFTLPSTATRPVKRALEGDDAGSGATLVNDDDEDDDMVATDVEDNDGEGGDKVAPMQTNMFGQTGAFERRIAGSKRAFGKTQSLPASAFTGMDF